MSIVCLSLASLPNSVRCVLFLYLVEGADPVGGTVVSVFAVYRIVVLMRQMHVLLKLDIY